ncbi:unnamed protein product [Candidula unifasciata]|uniref:Uncharacterized protein n=1 Tax=Candidula unifasciata TaxID=100452 RepID=A0A8S3YWU8_9EUPU|nr:unnamed protein product [Candidula unifasciata]
MAEEVDMKEICIETVSNGHNESDVNTVEDLSEPSPEREITLTDHLNKRLLQTFLQRLNQNDVPAAVGVNYMSSQPEIEEEELVSNEDEWENSVSTVRCEDSQDG